MASIRPFGPADLERCVEISLAAHTDTYETMAGIYGASLFDALQPDWRSTEAAKIARWAKDPAAQMTVAVDGVDVVGFVAHSNAESSRMGSIDTIAVDPAKQRRGVGAKLLDEAEDQLRDAGTAYIEAYVRDFPGHHPARALLLSRGFASRPVQPTLLFRTVQDPGRPAMRPDGLRQIEPGDIEACVRFGLEAFRRVYASFEKLYGPELFPLIEPDWEGSQAEYIRQAITDLDDETWVYDVGNDVAGFVVVKMDEHSVADIDLLAVDPNRQGAGIATALNRFAFDRCQEAGMAFVVVATADDEGHSPARRSYARAGFELMHIQWDLQIKRVPED